MDPGIQRRLITGLALDKNPNGIPVGWTSTHHPAVVPLDGKCNIASVDGGRSQNQVVCVGFQLQKQAQYKEQTQLSHMIDFISFYFF